MISIVFGNPNREPVSLTNKNHYERSFERNGIIQLRKKPPKITERRSPHSLELYGLNQCPFISRTGKPTAYPFHVSQSRSSHSASPYDRNKLCMKAFNQTFIQNKTFKCNSHGTSILLTQFKYKFI